MTKEELEALEAKKAEKREVRVAYYGKCLQLNKSVKITCANMCFLGPVLRHLCVCVCVCVCVCMCVCVCVRFVGVSPWFLGYSQWR
jgi:hypothetical protein